MKRSKKFSKRVLLLFFFFKAILVSAYPSTGDQSARDPEVCSSAQFECGEGGGCIPEA